jgi:c-di-GMP-binding flagellar brake protein YcgR
VGLIERWVSATPTNATPAAPEPLSDRRVTDPERIAGILQRLLDARALVSARVPRSDETFLTTVLGVDRRQRTFRLDELSPGRGHAVVLAERSLRAASRLDGVEIAFSATVAEVTVEGGVAVYHLPLPHLLHYHQRRASFRAPVGAAHKTTLRLAHPEAGPLVGEVRDVSAGGLGLRLQLPADLALGRGDRLSDCEVALPDGRALRCELEVCHATRPEGSRWTLLGTRFLRLDRRDQNLLAQFIVQLERERLKMRPPGQREGQPSPPR